MPIVLPSTARPSITQPTYVAPPIWKPVLAWVGVALGALAVFSAAISIGDELLSALAAVLFGLALGGAGGWWLSCERRDKQRADDDYRLDIQAALAQESMSGYIAPSALAPLTWDTPLVPVRRRWALVGSSAFALLLGAVALMPAVEPAPAPVATPPVPATSTVTVPAPVPTTESAIPTSSPAEDALATRSASEPLAPDVSESNIPAPAPAPVYEPVPAAAPVQQSAYYANCSAARAAGAAPLMRGAPGYSPTLDRDNDGVACE